VESVVPSTRRRIRLRIALAAAAVIAGAIVTVLVVGDARARVPVSVAIDGVAVGGASTEEAERIVSAHAQELAARPLVIIGPRMTIRTSGVSLGARPRVADAVGEAGSERFVRTRGWLRGTRPREVSLSWEVEHEAIRRLAARLGPSVQPVDAGVVVSGGVVVVRPGRVGQAVDAERLRLRLEVLPPLVRAPTVLLPPQVTTAEAAETARRVDRLTDVPRTIRLGTAATTLQPAALRALVRLHKKGSSLVVSFDAKDLAKLLPASTPSRDAEFRFRGSKVEIVPAVQGRVLDARATAGRLAASDRTTIAAAVAFVRPSVTTADLAALGVRDLVSEFTTYYPPGQPRVLNIQRASASIDGTILRPGVAFSMNEALGERTIAKGYVAAPQISGDSFVDSVGGGISQVATTLYNAAFFAGLELIQHQPHSLYIDRYPLGREATISWGGPELIFRNDWPAAVLIKVDATATSITVRFFSSRLGRRVATETSVPYGHGGGSFMVEYTRRVFRGSRLSRDEIFRVRYGASPGSSTPGGT
jgi:vancomycin resistance protein YoaR